MNDGQSEPSNRRDGQKKVKWHRRKPDHKQQQQEQRHSHRSGTQDCVHPHTRPQLSVFCSARRGWLCDKRERTQTVTTKGERKRDRRRQKADREKERERWREGGRKGGRERMNVPTENGQTVYYSKGCMCEKTYLFICGSKSNVICYLHCVFNQRQQKEKKRAVDPQCSEG